MYKIFSHLYVKYQNHPLTLFSIQVLSENNINTAKIAALVFDTTSLNSGYKNGIVVQLEKEFGRSLLQLACRHHIFELVGGASCTKVYGQTTGPKEEVFKKLIDNWDKLDLDNCSLIEVPRHKRELAGHIDEMVTFLQDWIKNSTKETLMNDYLELATLTLLFLGGSMPNGKGLVTIKAPGAFHHARWMGKSLYTLKIALFRNQLGEIYTPEQLRNIYSLAIFMSIFYTKAWLTCTSAANAPSNDLELMKKLLKAEANSNIRRFSGQPTFWI